MAAAQEVELVVDAHAGIGEGPIWQTRDNSMIWVDISGHAIHRYDPASGQDSAWNVGELIGAVATRDAGGYVMALKDGFATFDPATGQVQAIGDLGDPSPATRFNDGKCDSSGRFWAGTMALDWHNSPAAHALYRLDLDLRVTKVLDGVILSNGLGWSPDDTRMYYIDSPTRQVDVFDYDPPSGSIANRRTLIQIAPEDGIPDGLTVDAEGYLWVALYGGWAVRRYAPDGTLDRVVKMPVGNVTSVGFGGADLADLYVTCAVADLAGETLAEQPHAGGLFRIRPAVGGLPPATFKG